MPRIKADDVVVEFPIYGTKSRSFRQTFIRAATGGRLARDSTDHIVIRALDGVTFDFRDGDRVGLVGHNGSGKSTLLRVIAGAYVPLAGTLEVTGRVASMLSITLGMDSEATGYENIFLRGAIMGLKPSEIEERVDEICAFSELGDYIHMPLRTYSSGMSMRLAFAISTSLKADIILMDEWLSAGDASFTAKAQQRLNELVEQAKILVVASHSPETIRANCNKILRLDHGSVAGETMLPVRRLSKRAPSAAQAHATTGSDPVSATSAPVKRASDSGTLQEERLHVWAARGEPSYDENALVTWSQSTDFLDDERFVAAYHRGMQSGHGLTRFAVTGSDLRIRWRVAMYCWAAAHAARLRGDFVDCGTATGIHALAVCDYIDFNSTGKTFWLFDTFDGIPEEQMSDIERALGRAEESAALFRSCYDVALKNFAPYPKAHLVRGKVPDTLAAVPIKEVAYLAIDMNIAYPERAAIEHFWPLLVTGGIAILDNYGWQPYREQKAALDEFAMMRGVEVMMLPTGQGLLIKS
jgi:lipopolysaccharide transport system ATP-binding protein